MRQRHAVGNRDRMGSAVASRAFTWHPPATRVRAPAWSKSRSRHRACRAPSSPCSTPVGRHFLTPPQLGEEYEQGWPIVLQGYADWVAGKRDSRNRRRGRHVGRARPLATPADGVSGSVFADPRFARVTSSSWKKRMCWMPTTLLPPGLTARRGWRRDDHPASSRSRSTRRSESARRSGRECDGRPVRSSSASLARCPASVTLIRRRRSAVTDR